MACSEPERAQQAVHMIGHRHSKAITVERRKEPAASHGRAVKACKTTKIQAACMDGKACSKTTSMHAIACTEQHELGVRQHLTM